MSWDWPAPAALVLVARIGLVLSVLMVVVGLAGSGTDASAADGPQGSPSLLPAAVPSAAEPFSLVPPSGARCEEDGAGRSGSEGWRWHAFIVEAGRDLSTLEFGPLGPGSDYDATDGQITAALIAAGRGVWAELPAEEPRGLINPSGLDDLVLDPATYTLSDGRYLVGFACTDDASATRQWWSLEVAIQTTGAPFLMAGTDASSTSTTVAASSAAAHPDSTTTVAVAADAGPTAAAAAAATSVPGEDAPGSSGVSWSPLVALAETSSVLPVGGWAALVVVFGRIAYLLARPVRVHPSISP